MTKPLTIKIGSRGSSLALQQVEEVKQLLLRKGIQSDAVLKTYSTKGDEDKLTPLSANPADDFFTDTIDQALLDGEIDCAIHSAKDLPKNLRKGLSIFALTEGLDSTDSLVAPSRLTELPSGSKIGTSSWHRRSEVLKINPNVQTVEIRGTIEERLNLLEEKKLAGVIVATCALKRLRLDHLIREIMPWETTALQGNLAVVGREEDGTLKSFFEPIDIRAGYGCVLLVGAGPGDPELITLKGIKALNRADCVFYDFLASRDLLEHAPEAEKIYVGKRKGQHSLSQTELSKSLKEKACSGKKVVRLKGGDPLVFGRGAEEIDYLRSYHIPVSIIPGISSATGIPSSLGIPLTARGISSSVAFLSGHENSEPQDVPHPIKIPQADTLIFLMGLTKLPMILQSLKDSGWSENSSVIIISKGTTQEERIVTGTIETIGPLAHDADLEPPALIIVGETNRFFKEEEHSKRAEAGNQILYLGTNPEKYQSLGPILHWPAIEIVPIQFSEIQKQKVFQRLHGIDAILLTSRFAAKYFLDLIRDQFPVDQLNKFQWISIGRETAKVLEVENISSAIVPAVETSVGLLDHLTNLGGLKGKRVFFPRSSLPNPFLKNELLNSGALIEELPIYENRKTSLKELPESGITRVLFTSPSTVKNFIEAYGEIPSDWKILSKGPHTSEALKEAGYPSETILYDA